ncbi:MAG: alanine--tRNA ligase [Candidatus Wallbacteria bacterium HGW-Wallbacteria-1]|uniref:Alanine--tRNA ligase n=1 Tax=Candidatus Wallbacteria bacterium HGW-Wallbacteria-1 TaxID=2013854 RepID=A0A2N1PT40_9BACT|nr:MAG: alanine--tRNA ligase [Candidatus Wallbacteria bacterium HGW-Wallbacteria-1]
MNSKEIRAGFIDFFRERGHAFVESSTVVPKGDTTLLFTNAGMNQFKDVFLGIGSRPYTRAANTQKCMRVSGKHNDLDAVGRDTYHHTFFEMLGNWSFGDYYKKEAISWAWELLTDVWGLPKDKLYATVYKDDQEAEDLWKSLTDIDHERILRFAEKENFWEMGDTGPCGPCSEIHIDLGPERCDLSKPHKCQVNGECGRYIELWNLVFIQYNRDETGALTTLPSKHVDTGAGFERVTMVLQGADSNYSTDVFMPIINEIARLSGTPYPGNCPEGMAHRVIADHIRALTFTIADGALPGNEGRGYVLRRLLRRAARFGLKLGIREPFLHRLIEVVIKVMGEAFPEIVSRRSQVEDVIRNEEEKFARTLGTGLELLDNLIASLPERGMKIIPGDEAFKLYDTYGFPYELTEEIAVEKGFGVDRPGFDEMMSQQRERARAARKKGVFVAEGGLPGLETIVSGHSFVGYGADETQASVLGIWRDGLEASLLPEGEEGFVLLDRCPFYGESGGQTGDQGILRGSELEATVEDTVKLAGACVCLVKVGSGDLGTGMTLTARVSTENRRATERNHTATHLLHRALKDVLGDHVNQAGSLVEPGRLRFDFTHFDRLEKEQIRDIENRVNSRILADLPVNVNEMGYDEAMGTGAMALFEEKYGDRVRVVEVEGYSRELCGGTHVSRTGMIGSFRVVAEASVSQGIRRIEALTGHRCLQLLDTSRETVDQICHVLGAPADGVVKAVENLRETLREKEREINQLRDTAMMSEMDTFLSRSIEVEGVRVVPAIVRGVEMDKLRTLADRIMEKIGGRGVVVTGSDHDGKAFLVAKVSRDLISSVKAGDLVREMASICGGGGGGRPDMAQAGGKDPSKIAEALEAGVSMARKALHG